MLTSVKRLESKVYRGHKLLMRKLWTGYKKTNVSIKKKLNKLAFELELVVKILADWTDKCLHDYVPTKVFNDDKLLLTKLLVFVRV